MIKLTTASLLILFAISCRKEYSVNSKNNDLKRSARSFLKERMPSSELSQVDLTTATITHKPVTFVRIRFHGSDPCRKFILLKADKSGATIEGAKIVELYFSNSDSMNGILTRYSLDRTLKEEFLLKNGYMSEPQKLAANRYYYALNIVDEGGYIFPKTATKLHYYEGPSMRSVDYISLEHAWSRPEPASSQSTAYYQRNHEPPPATQYGGGGGSSRSNPAPDVIKVDIDTYQPRPAMAVQKMIDCFNSIPDQGATCSIELCADVPVDLRPEAYVDSYSTYPGHAFIQLKKSNQGKTITQNIGFYPVKGWKTMLTPAPVPGKFIDDTQHEYNASYKVNITFWQLRSVLAFIGELAKKATKYDIDNYNCTNFALDAFNVVRPDDPFTIPKYNIPMGQTPCYTPQALYLEFVNYRKKNPGEKFNFKFSNTTKSYVEATNTPCN